MLGKKKEIASNLYWIEPVVKEVMFENCQRFNMSSHVMKQFIIHKRKTKRLHLFSASCLWPALKKKIKRIEGLKKITTKKLFTMKLIDFY